jgi:hypothetical protein
MGRRSFHQDLKLCVWPCEEDTHNNTMTRAIVTPILPLSHGQKRSDLPAGVPSHWGAQPLSKSGNGGPARARQCLMLYDEIETDTTM